MGLYDILTRITAAMFYLWLAAFYLTTIRKNPQWDNKSATIIAFIIVLLTIIYIILMINMLIHLYI